MKIGQEVSMDYKYNDPKKNSKKAFCIKCDTALANEFRVEATRQGLSHEALFRNIWFFWKENHRVVAKMKHTLMEEKIREIENK